MNFKKFSEKTLDLSVKAINGKGYRVALTTGYAAFVSLIMADLSSAAGNIMTDFTTMINQTKTDILGISTAAAVVGIGTGAIMKKFSMGRQDRIETGNKLIRDSVIGWVTINGATHVLGWINVSSGAGFEITE